ncbi:hypothetical protein [Caballeronia choica]|uniref:hypothetical protein n=1 Tax=Caballeronia choica TaxID=326476 RepID=UPI000F745746|nr:hypothetical protein [Caballeronia choica]
MNRSNNAAVKHGEVRSRLQPISFSIKIVGSGPNDPLVFDYDIRPAGKPDEIISGKTDARGRATVIAQSMPDGEIRFRGFGAFGRVETQWQKILLSRQMTVQFGRYSFICEPVSSGRRVRSSKRRRPSSAGERSAVAHERATAVL